LLARIAGVDTSAVYVGMAVQLRLTPWELRDPTSAIEMLSYEFHPKADESAQLTSHDELAHVPAGMTGHE